MFYIIADEFGCDWLCSNPIKIERGWNQTKWIVVSSTFFSIPAIWQLTAKSRDPQISTFSYMLIATSLISANYWRNATRGWRRNLDLVFAKITFATGLYIAAKYLHSIYHRIPIAVIFLLLVGCYNRSTKKVNSGNASWVKYHFAFHVLLSICADITIRGSIIQ